MIIVSIRDITLRQAFKLFNCSNEELNIYLNKYAYANDMTGISKTFICLSDDKKNIIGYYTLCASSVMNADLPENMKNKLPKYPCPCATIARLAVDIKYQKQQYGKALLKDALKRILLVSQSIGIHMIKVDTKPEAKSFYLHYGFVEAKKDSLLLLLPIDTVFEAINHKK
ncbi:MAG: GNAT family N-acetyltransferase [Erysipelotrichaceae bacterium]|nr:GNAT family N-acetyltransferase [Erysipelotrichaceae bacterium]